MPTSIRKGSLSGMSAELRRGVVHAVGLQVQIRAGIWSPPTDVYETEGAYVVRVEIAGMREEDFEITVENNILMVSGSRPDVPERRAYQQMEIRFGKFESVVGLPGPIDLDASRAAYSEGFLTVHMPKAGPNQVKIVEEK